MPIIETKKTVFTTSDGREHASRYQAVRHEAQATLQLLGLKPDTAARLLASGVDTMRAIAATLEEFAGSREEATNAEDAIGQWPADANVAPRKGDVSPVRSRKPEEVNDRNEDEI